MSVRRIRGRPEEADILIGDHDTVESGDSTPVQSKLKGDGRNVAVLLFLYLLQGVPLGLMQAIPIILANNGINYKQQAQFSFVNWPFSLKLLWAPIVDSLYWSRMGRRKSWLVPCQYLIGMLMLFLSFTVEGLLGNGGKTEPDFLLLVAAFFLLNFLAATQDIAVDGWALTMLRRENVGYASTCNSVGQTAGYIFGFVTFMGLESASFCNDYIRKEPLPDGIVTLPGFLYFWGWVFLATTTLVWWFKNEKPPLSSDDSLNVYESYKTLLSIAKLKPIRLLAIILLTAKFPFSAVDALSGLKLVEHGITRENMALLAIPLIPLQILLPVYLSRKTAGPYPMEVYLKAYPYRIFMSLILAGYVYMTPTFFHNGSVPGYYYIILLAIYCIHQITLYSMFVSQMGFFAKISDPAIGGTYMTLVNTLANLGANWTNTLALWMVDSVTLKQCSSNPSNNCLNRDDTELCKKDGGTCDVQVDGYVVEVATCAVVGVLWLLWGRGAIRRLQATPLRAFAISHRSR